MFTNRGTGALYVGSTISLGERLRNYFKTHNKMKLRFILSEIKNIGINLFDLRIYIIPKHYEEKRFLLALEQYYILALNPQYNTLMVANGSPGGERVAKASSLALSIPIYVYREGILIYIFDSMSGMTNSAVAGFGMTSTPMLNSIKTGSPYLLMFTLTREPLGQIDMSTLITLASLQILVKEA